MTGSALPDITEGPNAPSLAEQKHGRHHNEERDRLDALEGGGRQVVADYLLSRERATYQLVDGFTGVEKATGPEPGALMQQAITALGLFGGTIALTGREHLEWGSIPTLLAGMLGRLTIRSTGPRVLLTTNAPRFLDPAANPAAGSTFRNLTLIDIVVDATAIQDDARGHHLLFGNVRAGASYSQINFAGLRFIRCKALNARATGTGAQSQPAIALAAQHSVAGQPQNFITDVIVDDLEQTGGMHCVYVVGFKGGLTGSDVPDIWIDGITVRNVRHNIGSASTGFTFGSHVHIGSWAQVGRCTVENIDGYGSRDVGVEINNFQDATVDGVVCEEYNGFAVYITNHRAPRRVRDQRAEVRNVSGRHLAANGAVEAVDASSLVCVMGKTGLPLGDITVEGVKYYRNIPRLAGINGVGVRADGEMRSLSIEKVSVQAEGVNHTSTTKEAHAKYVMLQPANATPVRLRDVEVRSNGAVAAGSAAHSVRGVRILGSLVLDADDVRVGIDLPGAADFTIQAVNVGDTATTIKGIVRRLRLLFMSATQPRGFVISGSATTTIPTRLDIVDADFSGNAAASLDTIIGAGNEHLVHFRPGSVWKAAKNPVFLSVGASPFVYRNVSGFRQTIAVRDGTVSAVEFSRDNVNWTSFATTTNAQITIENGEYIRITYSAVPNVVAIPVT